MIKANELRIGNFIECKGKVIKVSYHHIRLATIGKTIDGIEPCYNPISLTPEILEGCGFIDKSEPKNGLAFRLNVNPSDEFTWYIQDGYMRYQTQSSGFTRPVRHLKYLHQLQNAYFALTGEELTVNL